jgi:riboflavin kinase/FMN adenylyltransferase
VKIIRSLNQITKNHENLALTIGNFDGIHLGHLEIIDKVKKIAKQKNIACAILTFEPHPASFFKTKNNLNFRLTSLAQKLRIFKKLEIDYAIILPFNQSLSKISAENFAQKILIKKLKVTELIIGYDFAFGKNRQGNFKMLENYNFNLHEISPKKINEKTCSSTLIRGLLNDGNIALANQILGRNFAIEGVVIEGKKLARQMNFPTANLKAKPHLIQMKFGVYKSKVFIAHLNQTFNAITNFGFKPTFNNSSFEPIFETHIFNFNGDLYSKKIVVELIDFIREEKKFSSISELKKQIETDVKNAL